MSPPKGVRRRPVTDLSCSFCLAERKSIEFLLAGSVGYICDRCVDTATEVLAKARAEKTLARIVDAAPSTAPHTD